MWLDAYVGAVFLVTLSSSFFLSQAFIPRVCRHNLTRPDATCCPTPPGYKEPCGGARRGYCAEYQVFSPPQKPPQVTLNDDRLFWPKRLFKYGCHCNNNFWGFACHECWFGWTGADCMDRRISVRRNVFSYTAEEKKIFRQVMLKSHQVPSKDYVIFEEKYPNRSDPLIAPMFLLDASLHEMLIFTHRYASRSTQYHDPKTCFSANNFDFNHGGGGFLTWHRYFMLFWEREAARLAKEEFGVEDFRFPYWDWTDAKTCEVCTPELVGDMSNPRDRHNSSPFIGWRNYCGGFPDSNRCAACHTRLQNYTAFELLQRRWRSDAGFPSRSQVSFTLSRPVYYDPAGGFEKVCLSFTHAIEGTCGAPDETVMKMHNGVHNSVDGPFSTSAGSTNDPLFPIHHLQIDRIFQEWFYRHQPHMFATTNYNIKYGHCRDCNMIGFIPPVPHHAMLVDSRALGYMYDSRQFGSRKMK